MAKVFHLRPKSFFGHTIFPQNELKSLRPDLYKEYSDKYINRSATRDQFIPFLNCGWGDVIHLSPVEPSIIECFFMDDLGERIELPYFSIDVKKLNCERIAIYRNHVRPLEKRMLPDNFDLIENLERYREIPIETREYYRKTVQNGSRPLLFHGIPHVLYRGCIDV